MKGIKSMTFYEWATKRRITDTPTGDFLMDMREDHEAVEVPNDREGWELHLSRGCEEAREAFRGLWSRYQRSSSVEQPADIEYVYFIQADEYLFKIGMTAQNPHKRLASLQTGYPSALTLYGYIETKDAKALEIDLHKRFSGCRLNGEWFSVHCDEINDVLAEYGA